MQYLLLLLTVTLIPGSRGQEDVCMKTGPCSCESVEGKIDLTPLAHNDGTPKFFNISASADPFFYSWNPCEDFNLPNTSSSVCSNVAVCQAFYNAVPEPAFFNLGSQSDVMFLYDNTGTLTLQYVHNDNKTRISIFRLVCDTEEEGKLTITGERPTTKLIYDFELRSRYACFTPFPATSTEPVSDITMETRGPPSPTPTPGPSPSPDIKALDTIIVLLAAILLVVSLVLVAITTLICVLLCKFHNRTPLLDSVDKSQYYAKF